MKIDSDQPNPWLDELRLVEGAELLFEHLPRCLFYIKDRQGRFVALNELLATQLGAGSKADVLGCTDADFLPAYLVERYREDDRKVLDAGEVIRDKVELLTSADGVVDWFVTTKVPLRNRQGRIVALAGVTREHHGSASSIATPGALGLALEHIRTHYAGAIRIGELGKLLGLSVSAFERQFKRHFGMSPTEYIRRVRVHEACRSLLHTSAPISVIAQECGFSDQSHFTRDFVRVMRTTPAVF